MPSMAESDTRRGDLLYTHCLYYFLRRGDAQVRAGKRPHGNGAQESAAGADDRDAVHRSWPRTGEGKIKAFSKRTLNNSHATYSQQSVPTARYLSHKDGRQEMGHHLGHGRRLHRKMYAGNVREITMGAGSQYHNLGWAKILSPRARIDSTACFETYDNAQEKCFCT